MSGRLLQTVRVCFLEKKRKRNIVWEFAKMFETMIGVELLESYICAVCGTCRYCIFLVKFHGEHLPEFFISSHWLRASAIQQLLKALVNEDTLLRTHCCPWCFLGCANWETFVADTKCFCTKSETFFVSRTQNLCPQQMSRARANRETFMSPTMCPHFWFGAIARKGACTVISR